MQQKNNKPKPTTVDGVPNGGTTESGNTEHDGKTGRFKSKDTLSEIDKNFSVPFSNFKLLPILNKLGKQDGYTVHDIYDPSLGFTKDFIKELDQNGTDYLVMKGNESYSIDLKTMFPKNGEISNYVHVPLWHFDTNYANEKTSGKQVEGWGLKKNDTTAYLFSLPKTIPENESFNIEKYGNMDFDAFLMSKKTFEDVLAKRYFREFLSEDGNSLSVLEKVKDMALDTNKKLYNQILENREKLREMKIKIKHEKGQPLSEEEINNLLCPNDIDGFRVYYDDKKRIKEMSKIIAGIKKIPIKLIIKQEFVEGENFPRQNVYLKCPKRIFTNNLNCQLLNKTQNQDRFLRDIFRV